MQSDLDQAITAAAAAESTYTADVQNVAQIQQAIAAATQPLSPAQAQLTADQASYKQALLGLASKATDAANAL